MKALRPQSLSELALSLKDLSAESKILAGGTDLVIAINEGRVKPDLLLDITGISEMKTITEKDGSLYIGAGVTFSEITESVLIGRYFRSIIEAAGDIGSKQIRNRGTIGGNLANSSPAGDMIPPLLTLAASVITVNSKNLNREIAVSELIADVGKNILSYDEAIVFIKIPLPQKERITSFIKLGNRRMVTIARLSLAINLGSDDEGNISDAVVVLGAVGKTAFRAKVAEAALNGKRIKEDTLALFAEALSNEVERSIPNRYSLPYKREAVRGIAYDIFKIPT